MVETIKISKGVRGREPSDGSASSAAACCWYNDQWQVLAQGLWSQAYLGLSLSRNYVYGNYIDEALGFEWVVDGTPSGWAYYLHDHLYSPVAMLDELNGIMERYEYDAYGRRGVMTPWFTAVPNSMFHTDFGLTGREIDELDPDAANTPRLHHMHYRHRDYSPQLGRFMQQDRWEYVDGMNMYLYGLANPFYYLDPMGEAAIAPIVWPAVKKCVIVVVSACVGMIIGDSLPSECTPGSTNREYDYKPIVEWDPCEGGKVVGGVVTKLFYRCVRVHWALRNRGRWEIEDSQRWIEMF